RAVLTVCASAQAASLCRAAERARAGRRRGGRAKRARQRRKEGERGEKKKKKRKEGREREREYAPAIITAAAAAQSATRVVTSGRTAHTERGKKETGQQSDSGVGSRKRIRGKKGSGV